MKAIMLVLAMVLVGAGGGGCSSGDVFCETLCECQQCSDDAEQACKTDLSSTRSYARSAGCEEEYEAYIDCGTDRGTCTENNYAFQEACSAEYEAFSLCLGGGGPE